MERRQCANAQALVRAVAIAIVAVLAACTDLQVSGRAVDPAFRLSTPGAFRYARAPLGDVAGVSASAVAVDTAARSAISSALGHAGLHAANPGEAATVVVDFTLRDGIAVNAPGPDGPSDYRRSWRRWRTGEVPDGSGSLDHAIAETAFRRVLGLSVSLRPESASGIAWEGMASRSVAPDFPDAGLEPVFRQMCRKMFDTLP